MRSPLRGLLFEQGRGESFPPRRSPSVSDAPFTGGFAPGAPMVQGSMSSLMRRRRRSIPRPDAEAVEKINRLRRGRRRPKGSDGGESFPPVSCSERGDREAGSDVFHDAFRDTYVVVKNPSFILIIPIIIVVISHNRMRYSAFPVAVLRM